MTLPVSNTSTAAAQAYQAFYGAATTSPGSSAGAADAAFSTAGGANPAFSTASSGSSLNSSLLGALLGMNSATTTAAPNSATTAPDSSSGSGASAAHHHGISAYIAQIASAAGSVVTG